MYYADLTCYEYFTDYRGSNFPIEEVLNVGWLAKEHAFTTGDIEDTIILKLEQMIVFPQNVVNRTRGIHECDYCNLDDLDPRPRLETRDGKSVLLGTMEIWVPSSRGIVYAAPSLMMHYIIEHNYYPPQEFLDAVVEFDFNTDWNGQQTFDELSKKYRPKSTN